MSCEKAKAALKKQITLFEIMETAPQNPYELAKNVHLFYRMGIEGIERLKGFLLVLKEDQYDTLAKETAKNPAELVTLISMLDSILDSGLHDALSGGIQNLKETLYTGFSPDLTGNRCRW